MRGVIYAFMVFKKIKRQLHLLKFWSQLTITRRRHRPPAAGHHRPGCPSRARGFLWCSAD